MSDLETTETDDTLKDTGDIAHVPPSQRKDDDSGVESNALTGGDDSDVAARWFSDPEGLSIPKDEA